VGVLWRSDRCFSHETSIPTPTLPLEGGGKARRRHRVGWEIDRTTNSPDDEQRAEDVEGRHNRLFPSPS